MRKIHGIPLGRMQELIAKLEAPECWAYKSGARWDSDYTFQRWPNRAALLTTLRMQESRAPRSDDWHLVVKQS